MADEAEPRPQGPGVLLVAAAAEPAERRAEVLAREEGRTLTHVDAAAVAADHEPAEAMRRALRDAVHYTERRIAKVFEGRIVAVKPLDPTGGVPGIAAARIALTLTAEDETRVLHLEGAWAWNLAASGARAGDIVQIARDGPFVTLRRDRNETQGRVLDERDHVLRLRLGALDQAYALHAATTPPPQAARESAATASADDEAQREPPDPDQSILLDAARLPELLLATGERPPTGAAARRATDQLLRRRLATQRGRLEPGLLLVTAAASLPSDAAAALRAALQAPGAPHILLADDDDETARTTKARFPEGAAY